LQSTDGETANDSSVTAGGTEPVPPIFVFFY